MRVKESSPDFIPINFGMELPKSPALRFYPTERYVKSFKKNGYDVTITQLSQTKVMAKVTPMKRKQTPQPTRLPGSVDFNGQQTSTGKLRSKRHSRTLSLTLEFPSFKS